MREESLVDTISGMGVRRRSWIYAAIAVVLVLGATAPLFSHEITGAVRVWIGSTAYNHCFLIIPIVLYLCWQRRALLADEVPRPAPQGLIVIFLLSWIWFFAAKLDVLELRQFLFIGIVEAVLFTLLGTAIYRRMLGPLLYLFFLVPSGEFLVPKLQDFTARFAVSGLHFVGVPVYSDGTFIQIPEGTFVVAEACAGLRFLVASTAFGVLFALLVYNSWSRRIIFIALSAIIPVIANGIRAFGIIFAAHIIGSARAAVADHILYGWIFFSIVIFLLTLAGMTFAEHGAGRSVPRPTVTATDDWRIPSLGFYSLIAIATLAIAAMGPARAMLESRPFSVSLVDEHDLPPPASPWRRTNEAAEWQPVVVGADREFLKTFSDGKNKVERFVALYSAHDTHDNLGRDLDHVADGESWKRVSSNYAKVRISGNLYSVNGTEIRSGRQDRLVWSFYIVDGKPVAGTLEAKLRQAYASLFGRGRVAAFVAISVPMTDSAPRASDVLKEFVASMPSMVGYLAQIR
jgi:exosortase A